MQEDNDSDSSIDVIPEPEPSTNDSWGLALPDGLPNELNNMISETISQSDDDTSTIDLNPRKKVSVSLNTYIQRLNEAQNTLESLKPKLDTLNAKGTAAMWHRDSKRRRVEAVKKGEACEVAPDKVDTNKVYRLHKSGKVASEISDLFSISKQCVTNIIIEKEDIAARVVISKKRCSQQYIEKRKCLTALQSDNRPNLDAIDIRNVTTVEELKKGLRKKPSIESKSSQASEIVKNTTSNETGSEKVELRCKHCIFGIIKPGLADGMRAHLNRECLGILKMINRLQKDKQNLTDDQVHTLGSHFIKEPSGEICGYCRKRPEHHRDCSILIAMFLHLELHHSDVRWEQKRISFVDSKTAIEVSPQQSPPDSEVRWRAPQSNLPKFKRSMSKKASSENRHSSSSSLSPITSPTIRGASLSKEEDSQPTKQKGSLSKEEDSQPTKQKASLSKEEDSQPTKQKGSLSKEEDSQPTKQKASLSKEEDSQPTKQKASLSKEEHRHTTKRGASSSKEDYRQPKRPSKDPLNLEKSSNPNAKLSGKPSTSCLVDPERKAYVLLPSDVDRINNSECFVRRFYDFTVEGSIKKPKCKFCGSFFRNSLQTLQIHLKEKCVLFARKRNSKKNNTATKSDSAAPKKKSDSKQARRSPFPGPNRLKRRDERGLSNSSTDSEPPHRRHSTDDDVEVFAAESEEMRQDQTQGLLAGETLGKQQSESSNLMNNIKDLIQEGILSDCTSRKCISCSTGKLALAACQASLDGWDWKCNKCVCRLSVRLDSAIVESSISLAQFHKLYKYFKEDTCLETVSSELQMSVSDVKSIFDNLHKEAAAGGTKIKSEEQAVLLKIETPEKAPFFECGIVKVKTEQLDGSENQLFKEDPTGKLCQAHAKPNFSLSVQCPYKALVGEELCKVHDNRARLKLTRAFLSTGSRKSDLMKTTKPRKPPAKKEKEEKEAKKADKVEENLPFDEDEDSTNLVVVELEDCEDSPALHETGASFTSPVQSSTVEVMSTTELPVTAPPVTSSLTTSPKLARSVARSDATPDHVSSSRDETNMHVTTNTISEEQRSAEVRPAVLFQSETLELFDVEKYNVANDSDLHVLPKVVDKVRMMGEDMSLDEYLVVFWKNTLKLHTRQDLEDFMTYLLKLDLLETRMSILSDKKQRHYEDEVDQALNKLDIFSLLILHNFALLPESYRCLDSRTSLRLCKIIHTRSTPLPDREKDKVESIVTASYEPFDTSYLFKLRTLTHKQRNIAPTMVIEAILSHRFLAAPPFQKLRLANQYLSHIQSLDKCPDPLWPDYQTVEGDSSKDVMIRTLKVFFCNLYSSSCRENRTSGKAVKFLILKVLRQEIDVETLLFELKVVTNSAEPPPHVLEYLKDSVPVLRGEMFKQLQSKAEEHVNDIAVLQTHLICTPLRKMVGSVYLKCASDDTPDKNKTDSNESGDRQQTDSSESGDKAAQVLLKQFVSQLTAEEKVDLCKQFSSSGLTAAFPSKDIQTGSVGEVSSSVQDDVKIQTVSSTTQCEELETSENEVQCNFEDHHWVPMMDDSILHFPPHVASTDRSMIPVLLKYENLDKINEKFKSDNDITMGRLQNEIRRRLLIKRELEERDANIKRKREEFIRFNKSKGNYPDRNERIFPRVKQEESS